MAAASLELTYSDLLADLGQWMGWQRSGWGADETAALTSILKGGIAQFYWPPPLPRESKAHSWSFLKPAKTIDTVADQEDYDLPSDFGSLLGQLYYAEEDDVWTPIKEVGPGHILNLRSRDLSTGSPRYAAVIPQTSTGTDSQKWTLALVPAADAVYTLHYRYQVIPTTIDESFPYHLGNAIHSQTLLQSCLAIAERRFRDGERAQQEAFLQALAASVAHDRRRSPQSLGSMNDGANYPPPKRSNFVTYNGVLYDNR